MLTYFDAPACKGMSLDTFLCAAGPKVEKAKSICSRCPDINKCLDFAMRNEDYEDVVYGGMTGKERRALANDKGKVIVDYSA